MKPLVIAGNWKSNKTMKEAEDWLGSFDATWNTHITVILCAPFTLLGFLAAKKPSFLLAAQDVSPFGYGAYTGEVNAGQIKEFADWVIIGHSERRKNFSESDELLAKKVQQAKEKELKIIFCVPDDNTPIPAGIDIVAYEPVWAIGTGEADTPEHANTVISGIKVKYQVPVVIYGGSVTTDNVASFMSQPAIDGVLPGGASLDPVLFADLIKNAS